MKLRLADKTELSRDLALIPEERHTIREVAAGTQNEKLRKAAVELIRRAKSDGLWLECDCRSKDGSRPLLSPCHDRIRGIYYWRPLDGQRRPHTRECDFRRKRPQSSGKAHPVRQSRPAPGQYVAVLRHVTKREAMSGERANPGGQEGSARPPLPCARRCSG